MNETNNLEFHTVISGQMVSHASIRGHEFFGLLRFDGKSFVPYVVHIEKSHISIALLHPYYTRVSIHVGKTGLDQKAARNSISWIQELTSGRYWSQIRACWSTLKHEFSILHDIYDPEEKNCCYIIAVGDGVMTLSMNKKYIAHLRMKLARTSAPHLNADIVNAFGTARELLPCDILLDAYLDGQNELKQAIIRNMVHYHDSSIVPFLMGVLQDDSVKSLWPDALLSLVDRRDKQVLPFLIEFASSHGGQEKVLASRLILSYDKHAASDILRKAIHDGNPKVRALATLLLGLTIDRDVISTIYGLTQADPSALVRQAARATVRRLFKGKGVIHPDN